jgi:CRP/FNR family transcriptional regulator, cyclic AMP receptor protein
MAKYDASWEPETLIPSITQETLAAMIGTTRFRVSFSINRFRKQGDANYKGRIRVHKSLLNVVLQDGLFEKNSFCSKLFNPPRSAARSNRRARFV